MPGLFGMRHFFDSVDRLRRRGADVTARALPGFDHVDSWVMAMPRASRYLRTLD